MNRIISFLLVCFLIFCQDTISQGRSGIGKSINQKKPSRAQYGTASFYHNKFNGRRTASGEIFSQKKLTAASNRLPLGTWVRVTNMKNKKTVIVKVNDRLSKRNRRLIDLSRAAGNRLGVPGKGLIRVKVESLGKKKPT